MYINEGLYGSPLMMFAASLQQIETALVQQGKTAAEIKKALDQAGKARTTFLKNENKASDEKIVADITMMFYRDVDKPQHPIDFYRTQVQAWGKLDDEQTYKKYAKHVFEKTMIFDDAKWNAFVKNPDAMYCRMILLMHMQVHSLLTTKASTQQNSSSLPQKILTMAGCI
jgi:hypothetical protein